MSKSISSKLIRQGGYGCIFYPGITCSGFAESTNKFATKVQKTSHNTINEINIGKMIMKIPNYTFYFVPVIKSCPIKLKALHVREQELSKCKVISKKNEEEYILMKMLYISKKTFESLFNNKKNTLFNLVDTYTTLVYEISILLENKIVHLDLKSDNILYNTTLNIVQIIDFGISIPITKLTNENMREYFYVYAPDYYLWPFEVQVINFLLEKLPDNANTLNQEHINKIVTDVGINNKVLKLFSKSFVEMYKEACVVFLTTFIGIDKYKIIGELLKTYETWDNFSLSILYLDLLETIYPGGFPNSPFIIEFSQLLIRNILPDSSKRYSIKDTKSKFNAIRNHLKEKN